MLLWNATQEGKGLKDFKVNSVINNKSSKNKTFLALLLKT